MKKFSELGIQPSRRAMVGDKITIFNILNEEIMVCGYRIEDSKFSKNKSGKCLHMQIKLEGVDRVVFTGSDVLIDMIQQVAQADLPFTTIIRQNGKHFEFT